MLTNILNFIVCPICHENLLFLINKKIKNRIIDGQAQCKKCGKKIYIKNEIAYADFFYTKQTAGDAQRLRKMTIEQEIPKKWMNLFSKQELTTLKNEWGFLLSVVKKGKTAIHLDFATGTGRFLRNIIPKIKGQIVSLERDYPTCLELRYFLKRIKKYDRVSIICADARYMPFKNEAFDSITSWHGLDEPKIKRSIKESKRVLKKEAYFSASGIHYQKGSKSYRIAQKEKIYFITKEAIINSLTNTGFSEIEYKTFFRGKWNEKGSYLPVFDDFYLTYGVKARK